MEARGDSKSKIVGISMLVLSLLLTAAVSSLIYLAVTNSQSACTTTAASGQPTTEIDVTANVNMKSDGKEVKERVEYSKGGHIAYYYGDDGSFEMDDFAKGIHVVRSSVDNICYIIPVGTNSTYENSVEASIHELDGTDINMEEKEVHAQILDGEITDVSFLPERAHEECTNGYKWMSVVAGDGDAQDGLARQKRACYIYYWWCNWPYQYCYYYWCI